MKNKDVIFALSAGLTVASAIASFGLSLAIYSIKKDGVLVKLPVVGAVEVRFDEIGQSGVKLPSSAESVLAVLPALVVLSAIVSTTAAGFLLNDSNGGPTNG